ncbi:MICOS complex subunit mic25-a Coiled-coil-helix-coiled-coil-helix domain-containing protein 6A [Larimichthys crocea]|uniref:MICOS complex subunit mic25-a Coiled-coil-helix-coiled-coil-helix domain-containing protein 6A n=1 Tax=Larimichthys crocea TaxID=215358 RepID=A0A6G0J3L4_LARCR|nr:MICOS complex subunit mic25a isoform X5 [Larimichthys crocea]KAE8298133.1 MICOS complex subunit mic25-a Coiled-coil-helix-coiled-coil-helix domain-containing protein 6A [Larimichthys crocea]
MGGNGSTTRKVSFGLDEDEKVTVIEGVKLSEDVLRRMRESQGYDSAKPPPSLPDSLKPPSSPKPTSPSTTEVHEEMRKNYERQQALVQEQLAQLAQRERESATTTGLDELNPALIIEKAKAHEEQEKAKILARQLENREKELASISSFYKEQLEILEKRNLENYKQTAEQYNQAATEAEAHIRPRQTASLCTELQAKVLQCYRENPQQTLHCSSLAKQYMACVQQAKSSLTNHG